VRSVDKLQLRRQFCTLQECLPILAFKNEIAPRLLFDLFPDMHWSVPRIENQRLIRHRFGMLEPAADMSVVDPMALDFVLVPGVAFDRRGGRLGFGGGFYDRFLITTPALRVGVTYDGCLADELTCSKHDQWMDWVVTPGELITTKTTK
jgi:5,10-methenyltetrahydrofolate synthetase